MSRTERDIEIFSDDLKILAKGCFAPIAAGGGVRTLRMPTTPRSGLTKLSSIRCCLMIPFVMTLAQEFSQQCVIAIDIKQEVNGTYHVYTNNGSFLKHEPVSSLLAVSEKAWELYLNSINEDGTGQGYDQGF